MPGECRLPSLNYERKNFRQIPAGGTPMSVSMNSSGVIVPADRPLPDDVVDEPSERRPGHDSPSRSRWALVVTCVAAFMVTLDALVVITALPAIRETLGVSLSTLQW